MFMSHSIASFVLLSSQRRDGSPCRRMFIDIPIVLQSGIAVRDHSSSQGCVPAPGVCTEFEEVGNYWGCLSRVFTRDGVVSRGGALLRGAPGLLY